MPEWASSGFVRKYEFDLLLGIIRGIDQFQMSDLHQAGAAVGVAFDSSADFNPVADRVRPPHTLLHSLISWHSLRLWFSGVTQDDAA